MKSLVLLFAIFIFGEFAILQAQYPRDSTTINFKTVISLPGVIQLILTVQDMLLVFIFMNLKQVITLWLKK
ncbi:MAG: hypothetical protein FMNOHCHN_03870 [Ignavibacteriaceae bacterium]|nr:hypothetical protein [Ignavibacteriaceae bacterium]